jgi:hypothetical protein
MASGGLAERRRFVENHGAHQTSGGFAAGARRRETLCSNMNVELRVSGLIVASGCVS